MALLQPPQSTNARDAILENARRLCEDAQLLCDAGRYASCALLQIFCFEELGKYYLAGRGITYTPNWHRVKQEAALCLAAGRALDKLHEEKCRSMGWDYWSNDSDADAFDHWFLEDGADDVNAALRKVSSWLNQTRKGMLEKFRLIAAYVDISDNAPGKQLLPGVTYSYKSVDLPLVASAFDFIRDAFDCLNNESDLRAADLFRTEIGTREATD